ncbi:T9SS type A sorting domain-containing protein, partial [Flavobacterium sp. RHBU_3]|uniref:T9SS type A sorting domain-containing protein n=1 Tax=Flavobacterium sp. RHBU_3 TaxID=3391184 RepID=UPI003984CCFC
VTVTDANGCTAMVEVIITEPTALNVWIASVTNVPCNGSSTGASYAGVSGGVEPYTYSWSNGATEDHIDNVAAGTYTVTVTDANNCSGTAEVTITEPTALNVWIASVTNVPCNGTASGASYAGVSGGVEPYTYSWSNGATEDNINNVAAGTYTVTVTDANNCMGTAMVTITEPDAIDTSITSESDVLTVGQAEAGYQWYTCETGGTYTLIEGATSQQYTVTAVGSYSVVVTYNGCEVQSDCFEVASLSTETIVRDNKLEVYPNPSTGIFSIKANNYGSITAFDLVGKTVATIRITPGVNNIDLTKCEEGVYLLQYTSENNDHRIIKVIKRGK